MAEPHTERARRRDPPRLLSVVAPAFNEEDGLPQFVLEVRAAVAQLADVRLVSGPAMLRNENGLLNGYVYVDVADRDIGAGRVRRRSEMSRRNRRPTRRPKPPDRYRDP